MKGTRLLTLIATTLFTTLVVSGCCNCEDPTPTDTTPVPNSHKSLVGSWVGERQWWVLGQEGVATWLSVSTPGPHFHFGGEMEVKKDAASFDGQKMVLSTWTTSTIAIMPTPKTKEGFTCLVLDPEPGHDSKRLGGIFVGAPPLQGVSTRYQGRWMSADKQSYALIRQDGMIALHTSNTDIRGAAHFDGETLTIATCKDPLQDAPEAQWPPAKVEVETTDFKLMGYEPNKKMKSGGRNGATMTLDGVKLTNQDPDWEGNIFEPLTQNDGSTAQ